MKKPVKLHTLKDGEVFSSIDGRRLKILHRSATDGIVCLSHNLYLINLPFNMLVYPVKYETEEWE